MLKNSRNGWVKTGMLQLYETVLFLEHHICRVCYDSDVYYKSFI